MRILFLMIAVLIAGCANDTSAPTATGIAGHWRTLAVTAPEGVGPTAVEFTFRPDGTFTTRRDDGFGILAEYGGSYVLDTMNLRLRPEWAEEPSDNSARLENDHLTLTRPGQEGWKHVLERSAGLHPALEGIPRVPRSVDEAVIALRTVLPKRRLAEIRNMPEGEVGVLHFSLGTWIRNAFWLWRGNTQLLESCGGEPMHPDDASGVILRALWHSLREAR